MPTYDAEDMRRYFSVIKRVIELLKYQQLFGEHFTVMFLGSKGHLRMAVRTKDLTFIYCHV